MFGLRRISCMLSLLRSARRSWGDRVSWSCANRETIGYSTKSFHEVNFIQPFLFFNVMMISMIFHEAFQQIDSWPRVRVALGQSIIRNHQKGFSARIFAGSTPSKLLSEKLIFVRNKEWIISFLLCRRNNEDMGVLLTMCPLYLWPPSA